MSAGAALAQQFVIPSQCRSIVGKTGCRFSWSRPDHPCAACHGIVPVAAPQECEKSQPVPTRVLRIMACRPGDTRHDAERAANRSPARSAASTRRRFLADCQITPDLPLHLVWGQRWAQRAVVVGGDTAQVHDIAGRGRRQPPDPFLKQRIGATGRDKNNGNPGGLVQQQPATDAADLEAAAGDQGRLSRTSPGRQAQPGQAAASRAGSTSAQVPRRVWRAIPSSGVGLGLTWTRAAPAARAIPGRAAAG
jgi:hypothetical protein